MIQKPSVPKGTRDFSPEEMARRNYIFSTVRSVFERYGYKPIETPAMENLSTLLGKYGEEGDKLLFKILNSGNFLSDLGNDDIQKGESDKISGKISEKGLRYDLTVPFARYVVQHLNDITFPFKRYQIQPVWRADKPQKGRYREFYQCDVDVIGSTSLLNEVELIMIIDEIFNKLKLKTLIKLNNRKILQGIAEYIGESARFTDITVALDKIKKVGSIKVIEELKSKGISDRAIIKLSPFFEFEGNNKSKIDFLKKQLRNSEAGMMGIKETEEIFNLLSSVNVKTETELDISLARGLNYYTGAIFEVVSKDAEIGSICGGGRYDDLTGIFGLNNVSGVGISFGADRIYDVMLQSGKFPDKSISRSKLLFINFGETEVKYCLPLLQQVRESGINAEIYPDNAKIKKQMAYANSNHIEFVALVGEEELKSGKITLKNMISGEQKMLKKEEFAVALKWDI